MRKANFIIILLFLCITQVFPQEKVKIDSSKPSVYIDFVRIGKGEPIRIGDSEKRVWLRFVNNTKWSLHLSLFGVGNNEIGIHYEVEEIIKDYSKKEIPTGYRPLGARSPDSELKSGKSIVFSVPRNHLADNLKIKINYTYLWEYTKNLDNSYTIPVNIIYFYSYELKKYLKTEDKLASSNKKPLTVGHYPPNSKPTIKPAPKYPKAARIMNVSGEVVINILVDEKGNVEEAKVVSGHALLRLESLKAAKMTKFKPHKIGCKPVKVYSTLVYHFVP